MESPETPQGSNPRSGRRQLVFNRRAFEPCDFFSEVDSVLKQMDDRKRDQSFLEFLDERCPPSTNPRQQHAREWAIRYVSGFNAADPSVVGVHWLVKEMEAEERIDGQRAFRAVTGYHGRAERVG